MAYIPTTIKNAVCNMVNRIAFLPAIQREFEWSTSDIEKLFDSIMCQYPISSMLFWKVREENKKDWVSYFFIKDFCLRPAFSNHAYSSVDIFYCLVACLVKNNLVSSKPHNPPSGSH